MIRYTSNSTKTYNTNSRKPMDDAASLWPGKLKDSSTISLKRRKKKKKQVVNRNNIHNSNNSNYVRKYLSSLSIIDKSAGSHVLNVCDTDYNSSGLCSALL